MTEKRFILYEHKDNDYILDNPNVHLDFIEMLGDALTSEEIVDKLNELHEENQLVKDTLNELKSIDGFWDSALLQGYISKIANILGVDLE